MTECKNLSKPRWKIDQFLRLLISLSDEPSKFSFWLKSYNHDYCLGYNQGKMIVYQQNWTLVFWLLSNLIFFIFWKCPTFVGSILGWSFIHLTSKNAGWWNNGYSVSSIKDFTQCLAGQTDASKYNLNLRIALQKWRKNPESTENPISSNADT